MEQWSAATSIPDLIEAGEGQTNEAPLAAVAAATIGYYSGLEMPQRVISAMRGHAPPRGDVGRWPLDDSHVHEWEQTMRLRKRVTAAANLYRGLTLLGLMGTLGALLLLVFGMVWTQAYRSANQAIAVPFVVLLGSTILYYFTWRATSRSYRWAPLTMLILFCVLGALYLIGMIAAVASSGDVSAIFVGVIFLGFVAGFAFISYRSYAAIPKYLARPAWCQELVVRGGV